MSTIVSSLMNVADVVFLIFSQSLCVSFEKFEEKPMICSKTKPKLLFSLHSTQYVHEHEGDGKFSVNI